MDEQLLDPELIARRVEALGFKAPLPAMAERLATIDPTVGSAILALAKRAGKDPTLLVLGFNTLAKIAGMEPTTRN